MEARRGMGSTGVDFMPFVVSGEADHKVEYKKNV